MSSLWVKSETVIRFHFLQLKNSYKFLNSTFGWASLSFFGEGSIPLQNLEGSWAKPPDEDKSLSDRSLKTCFTLVRVFSALLFPEDLCGSFDTESVNMAPSFNRTAFVSLKVWSDTTKKLIPLFTEYVTSPPKFRILAMSSSFLVFDLEWGRYTKNFVFTRFLYCLSTCLPMSALFLISEA